MQYDWENLDEFLSLEDFCSEAVFTLNGGTVLPAINGILDELFLMAEIGEYDLESTQPRFICKTVDVNQVSRGDTVVINGLTYDVLGNPQDDGTGLAVIILARADV